MRPDPDTIAEFLRRIGHPVALVGRKPIGRAPKSMVIWPAEQTDTIDQACWLSSQYDAVYVNLNPLKTCLLDAVLPAGRSVCDLMIARRTRVLLDVDAHTTAKKIAREQAEQIKAELGEPLIASDSGNGFGLLYTCDLANDEYAKLCVRNYLLSLGERYSCLDTCVFGASRLTRLIGTPNRSVATGKRIPTRLLN